MENHHQVSADTDSPTPSPQQAQARLLSASQLRPLAQSAATWLRQRVHLVARALRDDWHTHKYVLCAVLLVCITTTVVVAYYLNHPQLEIAWDTLSYLRAAQHIYTRGQLVDTWRLPGYPLLIVLVCALTGQDNLAAQYSFPDPLRAQTVYALAGQDNLAAVSVVQAVLFVLATLELYVLAVLVLRRGWLALLLGLLVGTNLSLLSYIKPLMSEALALWLLVSLALAVAFFVSTRRVRFLWLITALTLALFLTRAEWIYLPLPLFGYLLLLARQWGIARRVLPHILLSLILLYAVLGDYIYINATQNNFVGVVAAQNVNSFVKVLQYDMQDEAPPEYAPISKLVDSCVARGIKDPSCVFDLEPSLVRNNFALAGAYAWAIIEHHPGEFLAKSVAKSVPLAFFWLTHFYYSSHVTPTGPFGGGLVVLQGVFYVLYGWNKYFPLCAALWLVLLCWRRTRYLRAVQAMGAIVLLALYGLILTTLGIDSYPRYHVPFGPLLILVIWGSLLAGVLLFVRPLLHLSLRLMDHYVAREDINPAIAQLLVALSSVLLFKWADRAMAEPGLTAAGTASPTAPPQQNQVRSLSASRLLPLAQAAATQLHHWTSSVIRALISDWRTHKYAPCAALLVLLTTVIAIAYYLNHFQLQSIDTDSYLHVVQQIQKRGQLVDIGRLPGYPLLIVLVYTLLGQGNLQAVSVVQAVLFVVAMVELYVLTCIILRRVWAALLIGLLTGTNLISLSYIQPIMSEALALWLVVSLALGVTLFVYTLRVHFLWLVTVCTLILFLTRPEWIYLPLPLFAYLLWLSVQRKVARQLLPHMLIFVVLLYAILGNYIYINAMANYFTGVTAVQNVNALGKVLQYDMQDEAPPQYAAISRKMHFYATLGIRDPYLIWLRDRDLMSRPVTYDYAYAVIEQHPAEFLAKSLPLALSSLTQITDGSLINPKGPFGAPLDKLQLVSRNIYMWNKFLVPCIVVWGYLLLWRRTTQLRFVQAMGAIVLMALYGLIVTTLDGYKYYDRLHTSFSPLIVLVIWGSLLEGSLLVVRIAPTFGRRIVSHYFYGKSVSIATRNVLVASIISIGLCVCAVGFIFTGKVSFQVGAVFLLVVGAASLRRFFRAKARFKVRVNECDSVGAGVAKVSLEGMVEQADDYHDQGGTNGPTAF